jgi:hypothetical protein
VPEFARALREWTASALRSRPDDARAFAAEFFAA